MSNDQRISTFQKINKGLEYFWLVITVACAAFAAYVIYTDGYDESKWYLLFPLLALAMYVMRRGLRKRFEAQLQRHHEAEAQQKKPKNK